MNSYLPVDKNSLQEFRSELKRSDNALIYTPVISWINEKLKLKNIKSDTIHGSSELMDQVATIINPEKAFSDKTIDTIIQLNSFCYYFEKNRDDFYRNGYSKNIESCKYILTTVGSDEKIKNKLKFR